MAMKSTPSVRSGGRYDMYLFIFFLHASCQNPHHFSLKVGQYCPTHLRDNKGRDLLKMPQQVSIFSYISPGSSLRKSVTSELVYNFPLVTVYFSFLLLRVPNNSDNCTVTFSRITVH